MSNKNNSRIEKQTVNFTADVHLIQILGEQLIGSEKVGVLELIKNAYDAGATYCEVWIEKVPGLPEAPLSSLEIADLPGPVISIIDNGHGMDETTIKNGWLRPATRIKTSVKDQLKQERREANIRGTRSEYERLVSALKKQHGGRLPLGEKGVGRFATHRLGKSVILQTKEAGKDFEWFLKVDWEKFDNPSDDPEKKPLGLEDIDLTLIRRPSEGIYGNNDSGTILRIYGGRDGFEWTDETLREIGFAIAQLRSPSSHAKQEIGFTPSFHCPQLSEDKFDVLTNSVPAPFICTAVVDENGKADLEIRFNPPSSLSKPMPSKAQEFSNLELRRPPEDKPGYWFVPGSKSKLRKPECGSFTCEIKVWIRSNEWIDYVDFKTFTDYLEEFGGVGIYRDGFSILPAQIASKDDWLRLSTRHIKRGAHISYYNMSGIVDLVQEHTPFLVDRTSREGLLETRAFSDLGQLIRTIVFDIDEYVQSTRQRYTLMKEGERISDSLLNKRVRVAEDVLRTISKNYNFSSDPYQLNDVIGQTSNPKEVLTNLETTFEQVRREVRDLREQYNALLEAAGYGIAIGVAVHEIEKVSSNLHFGLESLLKRASSFDKKSYDSIEQLNDTAKSLLNELKRISPLRVTRLEQHRKISIRDSILAASGAFRLTWQELEITFVPPQKGGDFEFFGSYGVCSQVFANLFDNSTYWLRTIEEKRRIVVELNPNNRTVIIADSGPGIDDRIRSHLFEPFFSLKNPPSGLGLYICNYYMRQMKGTIRESHDSERLTGINGAHFTLVFPKQESKG